MTAPARLSLALAALNGLLAVAAGAFGAHAARDPLVAEWLRTGAQWQSVHAAAAVAAVLMAERGLPGARAAAWLFGAGALVFGASLDALALTGVRALGAVTPVGGLLLMAGWTVLGWSALRRQP